MKKNFLFLAMPLLTAISAFAQEIPAKNVAIISFCEKHKGKKVDKGECWDLANAALNSVGAIWTPPYEFGKELNPNKDACLPGDIIQFEKVKIVNPDKSWFELPHHTAVIYKVLGPKHFILAEQNSNGHRYVVFTDLDLSNVKKGKYLIYRPQ